jgi:hypothetical protein
MAPAPVKVRIRNYNVGFGDCFLLTFSYRSGRPRNVLIDFGSTKAAAHGPARGMLAIAEQIATDCAGKLEMVVATHRHADHISGFADEPGAIIRSLKPEVVLQPWTEDPRLDPKASAPASDGTGPRRARALVSRLADMQALAAAVLAEAPELERSPDVPKRVAAQLRFLGETNIRNEAAVRNLMTMGRRQVYASFGTKLSVGRLLPGVKIDVLGPPTLKDSPGIEHEEDRHSEFWHLAARRAEAALSAGRRSRRVFGSAPAVRDAPPQARWLIPQIDRMRAEESLAIVRILDDVLNNTSLILLFEIGDSLLVFPGDAQLENWSYALKERADAEQIRRRLARARFYKVGHHGSLNATPKTLWKGFERRGATPAPGRLATMVSTLPGKHGSRERNTEVPREVLVAELRRMSDFQTTQEVTSPTAFWNDVELEL